ncbi:ATP-dependent DNA ligase [Rhodococcus sp. 27YEA15]|uniref:ATP-dependent DNA ligase n=1 Tax=Rhodococcus sp. 27YEA15 TaxID=3156259 RepID=UPI003C79D9BC
MDLPVMPPVAPMLAKAAASVPTQTEGQQPVWSYEPKWDGFRAIVFRDGEEVVIGSRGGKDLARYFPEMVDAFRDELPEKCVLDGELVVTRSQDGVTRSSWEALSERIHPATSRVTLLAEQTPAQFVAFDILALSSRDVSTEDFAVRRALLADTVGGGAPLADTGGGARCHVTAASTDSAEARRWFDMFEGAGLDGVVAKKLLGPYLPGKREMVKVKHARTADVVLLGYRPHKSVPGIGSLLLGLFDGSELISVGGASAFTAARRIELLAELEPLRLGDDVVAEGEASRWRSAAERSWIPLRPERVLEVAYDQMEGERFRHGARFLRWRPDRVPDECTFEQLEVPVRYEFTDVLAGGR